MTVTVSETGDVATCLALRRAVFMEEQGVSEAEEMDGRDAEARHLLATLEGRPVGTARLLIRGETAVIGRVCVLPDARGTGLGALLIGAAVDLARADPAIVRVELGAQVRAMSFYEKLGFAASGPVYIDAGIDHRKMSRDL